MGRLDCAICLLTGFDNYLRPGESVGSRVEDIVYPTAAARSEAFRHGVWTLPRTKTGDNQSVTMRHDAGAILLPMLTEGKPKRAYLFPAWLKSLHTSVYSSSSGRRTRLVWAAAQRISSASTPSSTSSAAAAGRLSSP